MTSFSLYSLLRDKRASSAAEFALVLPLLLILLIGMIDVGRFLWTVNRAEKSTQMGSRYAIVTTPSSSGLQNYDFVADGGINPGEVVPSSIFGNLTCTYTVATSSAACSNCSGTACASKNPNFLSPDNAKFALLVAHMAKFFPKINDTTNNQNPQVQVVYKNSGLGYAGDPSGQSVAPVVTVQLSGLTFTPTLFRFLGNQTINLPPFQSSLTMEDGQGTTSN